MFRPTDVYLMGLYDQIEPIDFEDSNGKYLQILPDRPIYTINESSQVGDILLR